MPAKPPRKPGIALLGVAKDNAEATVWESALKAEGIPCVVRNTGALAPYGADVPFAPGGFEVYVPGSALKRAREVLAPSLAAAGVHVPAEQTRDLAWLLLVVGPAVLLLGMVIVALAVLR